MDIQRCVKESFAVIGKEGSTNDGEGFIEKLWEDANSHFNEVEHLAKKDDDGNLIGIWGAMSDFSMQFLPWQNHFSEGLYLAGVEVNDDAEAPNGWTKWMIPSYEYLCVKVTDNPMQSFTATLDYIKENGHSLVGAVNDYINIRENGQLYMFFPIKKL